MDAWQGPLEGWQALAWLVVASAVIAGLVLLGAVATTWAESRAEAHPDR